MRAVLMSDVIALARVLKGVEPEARAELCRKVMWEADVSARYTRRLGKVHPKWGDGTLAGAAASHPQTGVGCLDDADTALCFETVLKQLRVRPRAFALTPAI